MHLRGPCPTEDAMRLIKIFVDDGTLSIHLSTTSFETVHWEMNVLSVIENNPSKTNILGLNLSTFHDINSMNFMQYFENLIHLHVCHIYLHGHLDIVALYFTYSLVRKIYTNSKERSHLH